MTRFHRAIGRLMAMALTLAASIGFSIGCGAEREDPVHPVTVPATEVAYDVAWSTFLGGTAFDQMREVFVEKDASVLIAGIVMSAGLPVSDDAFQPTYGGDDPAKGHPGLVGGDAYIIRLDGQGETVRAATYFGGSRQERGAYGVELAPDGDVVLVSASRSRNMPTTKGAHQRRYGGGTADGCVARLSADLSELRFCTYVGHRQEDWPRGGLALGPNDEVYIVGRSNSPNLETTSDVNPKLLSADAHGALIACVSPDGSDLELCGRFGGSAQDYLMGVHVAENGDLLVAGHTRSRDLPVHAAAQAKFGGGKFDAWVARLSRDGSTLRWCTYLGGTGDEYVEHRPLLLPDGTFLVCGSSSSKDFPTTQGVVREKLTGHDSDGFLTKFSPDGQVLWSTLLGGDGDDNVLAPRVDADGNVYVVGRSSSRDWPVTADALQPKYGGGDADGVLIAVSPSADRIVYSTFLGGSDDEVARGTAFAADGSLFVVGSTKSRDFPVTEKAVQPRHGGDTDGFAMRLRRRSTAAEEDR